jgi:hypothetical protein
MSKRLEWWQYLDWSKMDKTYEGLSESMRQKILERGYWSLGKGKFVGKKP